MRILHRNDWSPHVIFSWCVFSRQLTIIPTSTREKSGIFCPDSLHLLVETATLHRRLLLPMVSTDTTRSTSSKLESCIYEGRVFHRRRVPTEHAFSYELFFAFLDVDNLEALCQQSEIVKYNRAGLVSFDERDHLGDPRRPLRKRLEEDAQRSGVTLPRGPIFVLTHLRHVGYSFNPASFFYCYDEHGQPVTHCVEVRNHFGERSTYWFGHGTASPFDERGIARARKKLHVSPFLSMDGEYEVTLGDPGERLTMRIDYFSREGSAQVETGLTLQRAPWRRDVITRAVRRFPRLSVDIALWIYREAARLTLKGVRFFWHPEGKLPRVPLP